MPVTVLLSCENLFCERGLRVLFDGLSFQLQAGDVLRIGGANGSGKTSLFNILAGISSDYSGAIHYQGQPLAKIKHQYREQMLYLAHANAVKNGLSPRENLQWFASLYPTKSNLSIDDVLASVGLAAFQNQLCSTLSAGQRQRVALARLLLSAATLWILDEPFTAIDKVGVAAFEAHIQQFADSGGAVIISTHHDLDIGREHRQINLGER